MTPLAAAGTITLAGAALGTLVGVILDRPGVGAIVGASVGTAAGTFVALTAKAFGAAGSDVSFFGRARAAEMM